MEGRKLVVGLVVSVTMVGVMLKVSILKSIDLKSALKGAKRFEDLFTRTREIQLDWGEEVVGEISQLDVDAAGHLLLLDKIGNKVFLVDKAGTLIKRIEPGSLDPGVKWRPLVARFSAAGLILVSTEGSNGLFLFDNAGRPLKKIMTEYPWQYRDFEIDRNGFIAGYAVLGSEYSLKRLDPSGKLIAKGGRFPSKYRNYFERTTFGEVELDRAGNIYQINGCGPEIYKYSSELRLLKVFSTKPPYYRTLSEDLPDMQGNPVSFMAESTKLLEQCSHTLSLFALRDDLLLVQYIDMGRKDGTYLDLCSFNGDSYVRNRIGYSDPVKAASRGLIYRVRQPGLEKGGDLPNPVVIEYRFRF